MYQIEDLIAILSRLPGLGKKTASKLAYFFVKNKEYSNDFIKILSFIQKNTSFCPDCGCIILNVEKCSICSSDILLSLIPKKLKGMDRTYSFSIISRYAVFYGVEKTHNWVIVGSEYKKLTDVTNQAPIDLAAFSNAFGDKIRVKIVDLIRENGEMTLADLSKNLGVVNTIAIYHLDILKKENLMLQRHNGRKVLYSLNIAQITRGLTLLEELCGMTSKENN